MEGPLYPSTIRQVTLPKWLRQQTNYLLYLVPGGRFLITLHAIHVCLWDLGCPSLIKTQAQSITEPLASVDSHDVYSVHSSPDGMGLRFLLSRYPHVHNLILTGYCQVKSSLI